MDQLAFTILSLIDSATQDPCNPRASLLSSGDRLVLTSRIVEAVEEDRLSLREVAGREWAARLV